MVTTLSQAVAVVPGPAYPDRVAEDLSPSPTRAGSRQPPPATDFYEDIVCEAKYANFRRFEVKARIR